MSEAACAYPLDNTRRAIMSACVIIAFSRKKSRKLSAARINARSNAPLFFRVRFTPGIRGARFARPALSGVYAISRARHFPFFVGAELPLSTCLLPHRRPTPRNCTVQRVIRHKVADFTRICLHLGLCGGKSVTPAYPVIFLRMISPATAVRLCVANNRPLRFRGRVEISL